MEKQKLTKEEANVIAESLLKDEDTQLVIRVEKGYENIKILSHLKELFGDQEDNVEKSK